MKEATNFTFNHLANRLNKMNELSDSIANVLQIDRNIHSLWVSIEKNKLLVMTDDSSFATQLRFQQNIIRQHVNKMLLIKLKSIHIKVITTVTRPKEEIKEKCYQMLPKTANILLKIAHEIEDDEIKNSLKKFALSQTSTRI